MESNGGGGGRKRPPHGEPSEQDEMKIFLKVTKTVAMEVKKSETVGDIKERFQKREGIPAKLQKIFYGGNPMKDEKTLLQHGISSATTLHLFLSAEAGIKINVKLPPTGKTIVLDITKWDTIKDIKVNIYAVEGIRVDHQHILYGGRQLDDSQTLASCNIQQNSTLNLVISPRAEMHISVCIPDKETIGLDVKTWYTTWDVKSIIESIVQISPYKHKLSYAGVLLDDSQSLSGYNIENGSTLQLVYSPIQIFLRIACGNTVTLEVESSDTIEQLKEKIYQKTRLPTLHQSLIYAGRSLMGDRCLADYNVQDQSTLHLVFAASRCHSTIWIFIKSMTGETKTLEVVRSCTIDQVKERIYDEMGGPPQNQDLVYGGEILTGDQSLAYYNVCEQSTLHLVFPSHRLSIYLVPFKESINLRMAYGSTIKDVKIKIRERKKISVRRQMLFYGGKLLSDNTILSHSASLPLEAVLTLELAFFWLHICSFFWLLGQSKTSNACGYFHLMRCFDSYWADGHLRNPFFLSMKN